MGKDLVLVLGGIICLLCSSNSWATDEWVNESRYIASFDGTRLAVDVWRPRDTTRSVPLIVRFTPYWRAYVTELPLSSVDPEIAFFLGRGYAYATVDLRGSGASFGRRTRVFSVAETRDIGVVIDELSKSSWSNGRVATTGISYSGNAAEHATFAVPKALWATVPRFTDYDWYSSILFPGGLVNRIIHSDWSADMQRLDANDPSGFGKAFVEQYGIRGVKPVDADTDGKLLAAAIREHRTSPPMGEDFENVVFRDDMPEAESLDDALDALVGVHLLRARGLGINTPAMHWGSFMDAGTAAGVIARFVRGGTPGLYLIGPWSHGARHDADPFNPREAPVYPSAEDQWLAIDAFLGPILKEGVRPTDATLIYQIMGTRIWRSAESWPPAGMATSRYYLSEAGGLEVEPADEEGSRRLEVDQATGTGQETRWSTQWGRRDVFYDSTADAPHGWLVYTSEPVARDLEITGNPRVNLRLLSDSSDGYLIVYLQAVAPDGRVTMLSEGHLRLLHRRTQSAPTTFQVFPPYRSFARTDASEMPIGEPVTVEIGMLPLSARIPAGWALRVAVAGQDSDSFAPLSVAPGYQILQGGMFPSYVDLPIRPWRETRNEDPFRGLEGFASHQRLRASAGAQITQSK